MAKTIKVLNMAKKDIFVLKCCLLGDPGVGKTSLISQFVKGKFKKSYQLTVGLDVSSKDIILDDGRMARLSIHDIGGQERFNQVRHLFYQGAHVALLVFDVTRPLSLKRLENVWSKELMEYNQPKPHQPPLKTILVGNKIDQHPLDIDRTGLQKKYSNIVGVLETSAATGAGIEELKAAITEQLTHACRSTLFEAADVDHLFFFGRRGDIGNPSPREIFKPVGVRWIGCDFPGFGLNPRAKPPVVESDRHVRPLR